MWLNDDVRFCFTVFEDNEQNEWGDTLEHTWWKDNWPACTTKWLYVWGMCAGETCVSTTPPFQYHNTGIDPVATWGLIFHEPWSRTLPPPLEFQLIFRDPWGEEPLELYQIFYEPWTS